MKSPSLTLLSRLVFAAAGALLLATDGFAAPVGETLMQDSAAPPAVTGKAVGRPVFSLLPRSLQKHPRVDFNVISERTEAGRRAAQPAPGAPVYYELSFNKTAELGSAPTGGGKAPDPKYVEESLRKGLAQHNLLSAQSAGQPATLLLVCHWGEYSLDDFSEGVVSQSLHRRALLDRARLIGGDRFAAEFADVLVAEDLLGSPDPSHSPFPPIMGDLVMPSAWSPIVCFMERSPMNRHLVEESLRGCYFVVVSAYEMQAALQKKRVLLWRTRMTVNSDAISMQETLIPLIKNGSAFLGKDMAEPSLVATRIDRVGRVDFGPPQFLYWVDRAGGSGQESLPPSPPPEKAAAEKPPR